MNTYGHCASIETVGRVDMSLELTLSNSDSFIPDGIETKPNLSPGTASVSENYQGSVKLIHPQITNLNLIGKKRNFPSNLAFLTTKSVHQYCI